MRRPLAPISCFLFTLAALAALAVASASAADAPASEGKFPYKAAVTAADAVLRAGPGESYYATEKLQPGTTLEVYHRDRAGWLAVRPLPECFSWVSSRHLTIGADGLAEVTDDRVASRIGSSLGDMRDVVQVRLGRGEVVELVEPAAAGPTPWHKIVPPAGEFRWIHERFMDRAGATPAVAGSAAAASTAAPAADPAALAATPSPAAPGTIALPAGAVATLSAEQFRAELDDINTQLSLVLAQPSSQWQCGELTERIQKLLAQTQDTAQRSEARAVAGRIAQAEEVRRRIETPNRRAAAAVIAGRNPAGLPGASLNGAGSGSRSPDSRYDGAGRLVHVEPGQTGGPRFALVDERGRVLNFVTPAPGVNMNYYVGRRVGVIGTRTTLPEQDSELVTARQVSPLEGRLR